MNDEEALKAYQDAWDAFMEYHKKRLEAQESGKPIVTATQGMGKSEYVWLGEVGASPWRHIIL